MSTRTRYRNALAEIVWAMRPGGPWSEQDAMYLRGARMRVMLMALGYEHSVKDDLASNLRQIERIIALKRRK